MYTGECNRCGLCCQYTDTVTGLVFRCTNLEVNKELGQPEATRCTKYGSRWLGMPIKMKSTTSSYEYDSQCLTTYPRPEDAIPPECSYKWDSNKTQLTWFPGYAPKLIQIMEK